MRNAGNLLLARAFRELGQVERAYSVAGRRDFFDPLLGLAAGRERIKLALAVGDTARFLREVSDYLRWRRNAEPVQRERDEPLRAELARLTGEPQAPAATPR